jgi:hypothetical protein
MMKETTEEETELALTTFPTLWSSKIFLETDTKLPRRDLSLPGFCLQHKKC